MMSAHALDPAFAIAARQVRDGTVPFVILGVAGADGVARLDAFPPVEGPRIGTNAVCLLASITKPIVAVAVMRLVQDGRFPLTAPLSRWLPELDAAGLAPFTAWHVLTHTTGIGDVDLERLLREGGDRPELIRRTIAAGQDSLPGSQFRYASVTFDLLVEAVERAVGRPFDTVLHETLLDPLGMSDTTFDPAPSGRSTRTGCRRRLGRDASGAWSRRRHRGHGDEVRLPAPGWRRAVEHGPRPAAVRAGDAPRRRARRGAHPRPAHRGPHDPRGDRERPGNDGRPA